MQEKPYQCVLKWAQERPNDIFLRQIIERQFTDLTYLNVVDQALRIVTALRKIGLEPGDKIGLISKNCAQWVICDLAMMLGSYISVPIFPTAGTKTIAHILDHSNTKALFVGKLENTTALTEALLSHSELPTISFPYPTLKCKYQWNSLLISHQPATVAPDHHEDDIMSIVYTSGTSGLPKGAMLSYGAYTWSVQRLIEKIGINKEERLFSYLPLAHITERVYIMGCGMMAGICTAFPESLETFVDDVKMQRPTLFISVPRLWALFQQRIQQKIPDAKLNLLLKIPFINEYIKRKIACNLGLDKARVLGCGSAPVSVGLLHWFDQLGLHITEAWGLTESFAYSTLNYPFRQEKIGTVGNAGPGVEIKLSEDGEVFVKSKGLFSGYYKDKKASQSVLIEGWLHTGDKGLIDSDGYLRIQGRINDTFKTAKGKFVCPVPIEKHLLEFKHFEMLCLIGSGMPGAILLAVPFPFPVFDRTRYEKTIKKIIENLNETLESHERIRGVLMIKEPWSVENNLLTPTLKIKRYMLEKSYNKTGTHWPSDTLIQWEQ